MNTRKLGALALAAALLMGALVISDCPPSTFIDPAALLLVLGIVILGSVWSHTPSDITSLIRAYLRPGALQPEVGQRAHALFVHMTRLAHGAGYISILVGAVASLRALDDPSKIGPATALALLGMLYSLVLGTLILGSMSRDCLARIEKMEQDATVGL